MGKAENGPMTEYVITNQDIDLIALRSCDAADAVHESLKACGRSPVLEPYIFDAFKAGYRRGYEQCIKDLKEKSAFIAK